MCSSRAADPGSYVGYVEVRVDYVEPGIPSQKGYVICLHPPTNTYITLANQGSCHVPSDSKEV